MLIRAAVIFAMIAAMMVPSLAQEKDGLKPGDIVTGRLRLVKTRHPNGTPITVYQIVSNTPKPLAKEDEFCNGPPKLFHIVANDKALARSLASAVNKTISIHADDFYCSHTAWHIGDVVVTQWRFKK